ncbi:MAG: T9SS C-terminal target domain-containing protein [Bacteroidia bacterium]|nr:T9SS C-terminal target domain-containing protein [Bacteroidia bacterium]
MKRFQLALAAAALILLAGTAMAQIKPTAILGPGVGSGRTVYHQVGNRTLTADSVYILTGIYFVDSTYTLTIPAGTLILGDSAAVLTISRGGQILATGTALNPIVMTSAKPVGERRPGDWAGVVILGNAPTNQVNPQIEGGIVPGSYGGPNPTHSSGTFQYVRIEYAGYRFQLNNETNGLTLGGVGSGTTIDHVQVSYSFDDGFEFFGGTVNAKYLVTVGETDDGFDTDFGYSGKVQFGFGLKDPNYWDPTDNSRAIETDNCGSSSCYATSPRTNPIFSNFTLVGPKRTNATTIPTGERFDYALMFRRGTQQNLLNSAVLGYERSMSFRDVETYNSIDYPSYTNELIRVRNTSFASFVGTVDSVETSGTGVDKANVNAWLNRNGNIWSAASRQPDALGLQSMSSLTNPDPRPLTTSELASGADFTGLDPFFTATAYRGAFDPNASLSSQWTAGWTEFDPQSRVYNIPANATYNLHNAGWNIVSVPTFVATDSTVNTIFPGTVGTTVYGFNGTSYNSIPGTGTVSTGAAYWAYWPTSRTTYTQGNPVNSFKITVNQEGWVLIGGVNGTVRDISPANGDADVVTTPSNRILAGDVWGYNGATYETVNQMNPGRGYWVYITGGSFPVDITVTKNF